MRKNVKNLIYDKMHRGFVYASVAVTIGGSIFLGVQVYHYFTVVKPLQKQMMIEREQQLLSEGMDKSNTTTALRM